MPKAIVVDDLRTFDFPDDWDVVHARTVEHAAVELVREPADALYLDHDLGLDKTTRLTTFILYLYTLGQAPDIGTVYLQTSNPVGQSRLRTDMERCGYKVESGLGAATLNAQETILWTETARLVDEANNPY